MNEFVKAVICVILSENQPNAGKCSLLFLQSVVRQPSLLAVLWKMSSNMGLAVLFLAFTTDRYVSFLPARRKMVQLRRL